MTSSCHDVVVVGAGAAGLTASIFSSENKKNSVVLLDSKNKIGAKILISGGTRCNVTHRKVSANDYHGGAKHYVRHVLEGFTSEQTIDFFKTIGVELVLEPTGKYFPSTHSGKTVLEALLREAQSRGVVLEKPAKVSDIQKKGSEFQIYFEDMPREPIRTRRVILATGGLSYPETGSDGSGLAIAAKLGHRLAPNFPALTPLTTSDEGWKALSGVTVEAEIFFYRGGKKRAQTRSSFLFTHSGFSGPAALDISRHVAEAVLKKEGFEVFGNFIPNEDAGSLAGNFEKESSSLKQLKNYLAETYLLPASLSETLCLKAGFDPSMRVSALKRQMITRLAHVLTRMPLEVQGVLGYKKAEVTAGGVELGEVKIGSMESKRVPGLYFAGEILDMDGRIGGFNFQWAWSTGAIVGQSAARSLE